ncbi:MAG: hypothetical protein ACOCV2_03865 [Persicimonas sp.]
MSEDGADEDGEHAQWQQELDVLQEDSASIFSLAYAQDEEEFLTGTVLPGVEDDACSTYVDWVSESPPEEVWVMNFDTSATAAGEYDITSEFEGGEPEDDTAQVRLLQVVDGESGTDVEATGGTVSVTEAPSDLDDWESGTGMEGHIRAEFPKEPMRTVDCEGGESSDGGFRETCTCRDGDGDTSTCTRTSPDEPCCESSTEVVEFDSDIGAVQCGYLCYYPQSLPEDPGCQEMMPGN